MPNKHFCQGPTCHEKTTTDRFLKSRGVVRGRYAYTDMDKQANGYYYFCNSDKYFSYFDISVFLNIVSSCLYI